MRRIYTSDKLPSTKAAFHMKKLVTALDVETATANELHKALVDKYCEFNEDGTHVLLDNQPGSRQIKKEFLDVFNKESAEMHDTEVDIDVRKVDVSILTKVGLAPAHLTAMDAVIDWANFDD